MPKQGVIYNSSIDFRRHHDPLRIRYRLPIHNGRQLRRIYRRLRKHGLQSWEARHLIGDLLQIGMTSEWEHNATR